MDKLSYLCIHLISLLWIEMYSPKRYFEVLTPVPQKMAFSGKRVMADIISSDEVILE